MTATNHGHEFKPRSWRRWTLALVGLVLLVGAGLVIRTLTSQAEGPRGRFGGPSTRRGVEDHFGEYIGLESVGRVEVEQYTRGTGCLGSVPYHEYRVVSVGGADELVHEIVSRTTSPNGRWMIAVDGCRWSTPPSAGRLKVIDSLKGRVVTIRDKIANLQWDLESCEWSKDGQFAVVEEFAESGELLWLMNPESCFGQPAEEETPGLVKLPLPAGWKTWNRHTLGHCWAPDGRSIAVIGRPESDYYGSSSLFWFQLEPTPSCVKVDTDSTPRREMQIHWRERRPELIPEAQEQESPPRLR